MNKRLILGLLLSAALLGLLAWQVNLSDVGAAFAAASPGWLAACVGLHLGVLSLKAVRWGIVLNAVPHPGAGSGDSADRWLVFDALFLGYFGNYVLPAKLGELGRSALYSQRAGLSVSATLATILFERLIDALLLVGAFYLTLIALPLPEALPEWMRSSASLAGGAALTGTAGATWLVLRGPDLTQLPAPAALERPLALAQSLLASVRRGLSVLRAPRVIATVVAWTVLIWAVEAASIRAALAAFGYSLSWAGAVVQMVISSFAIAAPSAPGGLGIHQWVSVLVLSLWGVSQADATAASLVMTFAVILWVVPLGLMGLWRQGVTAAELQATAEAGA